MANLIGPGDKVLCCIHGYFGNRIRQMCERQEAEVTAIEGEWGKPSDTEKIEAAFKQNDYKVITVVHAETPTVFSSRWITSRAWRRSTVRCYCWTR